jgi:hypothetical protein
MILAVIKESLAEEANRQASASKRLFCLTNWYLSWIDLVSIVAIAAITENAGSYGLKLALRGSYDYTDS